MERIKSLDELKDGDPIEIREIKVNRGELGIFRAEYFTAPNDGPWGLAHDSWRVKDRHLVVHSRQVKNGTVDFSTIKHQTKDNIVAYIPVVSKERLASGWIEVYKLDNILEGGIKLHVI